MLRSKLTLVLFVAFLAFGGLAPQAVSPAPASAATCRQLSAYTDYVWSSVENKYKPTLIIYNGGTRPNPSGMTISYNGSLGWERVPSPSDWGVRTDAPQFENRNGWYGYFIATRWYSYHAFWNDDWRWSVQYCG